MIVESLLFWFVIACLVSLISRLLPNKIIRYAEAAAVFLRRHIYFFGFLFLSILFTALLMTNRFILNSFMSSADEHSCYFFAECIKNGKLWATPHPLQEFFDVVHIGSKGGKWFSVYPPGWPAIFALALKFNMKDIINPLLSTMAVFFLFRIGQKIYGLAAAILGLSLMCMTPFFLFNSAAYFSHPACLLFACLFLYSYLKWEAMNSILWAALTALALGYGLGTRYLTMAAIAIPFFAHLLFQLIRKQNRWDTSHLVFFIVLTIMIFINLWFNFLVTGDYFEAPNHYYHRWERLGFHSDYSILDATKFAIARIDYLMGWASPLLVGLYVLSLFGKRSIDCRTLTLRYLFFIPLVAYMFYYSWGGNQFGPRYLYEGFPFLALAGGEFFCAIWIHGNHSVKKSLLGILAVMISSNFYLLAKQGRFVAKVSHERKALYSLVERTIHQPAIVFIHGFLGKTLVMAEEDAIRNHPHLDSKILYAHDLGNRNVELKQYYPERKFYLGTYDKNTNTPKLKAST